MGEKEKVELCFRCGEKEATSRHHVPPRSFIRARVRPYCHKAKFTIPVCADCHKILDDELLSFEDLKVQYNWVAEKVKEGAI